MSIDQGTQENIFGGMSSENAVRIKRQNEQRISVVIGNPPYNANQANFNDFNKNREYEFIDKRIKETFVKNSTAQKTKVYDMYARFYRWAMDRVDENGVVAFVTNSSFIDSKTYDGFRKCIQDEFNEAWVIDLKGNARTSGERRKKEAGNVFSDQIRVGIAICFLIKNKNKSGFKVYHHALDDYLKAEEKIEIIQDFKIENILFENITPKKNNWINLTDNDWDELLDLKKLFKLTSNGVSTNRDEWVFDFSKKDLEKKAKFLSTTFNKSVSINEEDTKIKWSRDLKNALIRKTKSKFESKKIVSISYRPFSNRFYYSEKLFSDVLTQNHYDFFGDSLTLNNKIIGVNGNGKGIKYLATNIIADLHFIGDTKCLALYSFSKDGTRRDNITKWGLEQFQTHYNDEKITKEDIFHYIYGVLHNPEYRKKYEQNLKREFPRLPFYDDFSQWVDWGKRLMELHIGYEQAEPFALTKTDVEVKGDKKKKKLKVKLRAKKDEGIIELDEMTTLSGIPPIAWEYKLGNRSALEWVLDQYKEKKPRHKTIAEKFDTYRFADYKKHVIGLLQRVTTVSVGTMEVIEEMGKK